MVRRPESDEDARRPGAILITVAAVLVFAVAFYFVSRERITDRERVQGVTFVDVPEVEEPEEEITPEETPPDVEMPDLPPTPRVDPVQNEFDNRDMAQDPLSLVGEADDGPADAFRLGARASGRGIGRGRPGGAGATYADMIKTELNFHLRGYDRLNTEEFSFSLRLRVNADASVEIIRVYNVTPADLAAQLEGAVREFKYASRPPPQSVIGAVISLRYTQSV